jgi:hypothetical protein
MGRTPTLMAVVLGTCLAANASAVCPELAPLLTTATDAFADMDDATFLTTMEEAESALACAEVVLTPAVAAAWHQASALKALIDGDDDATLASLRAMHGAQPDTLLPAEIAPAGGPLARKHAEAIALTDPVSALGAPAHVTTYVDGSTSNERPTERPALLQVVHQDALTFSGVLAAGAQPPAWPADPAPPPMAAAPAAPTPSYTPPAAARRGPGALGWSTMALGGSAAGLFGTSVAMRLQYDQYPSQSTRTVVNSTYFASIGAAATSVGLGTAWALTAGRR